MTARAQMIDMVNRLPDTDLMILLEVAKRFMMLDEADDWATADDIRTHEEAMEEYRRGETIPLEAVVLPEALRA